jgi:hypothetical protein
MKKLISGFVIFVLVAGISLFVYAQSETIVKLIVGNKEATVNGKTVTLDVPPQIIKGRTLVPLRFIAEALGAKVDFEPKTQAITLTLKNIESLETEIADLTKQIETLKNDYSKKITDLEKEISTKNASITEKDNKIKDLELQITQKEAEITSLNEKVSSMEKEIAQLREDLKNAGGSTAEKNPPVIKINNLVEGQTLIGAIKLDVKIEDESGIVFVRVKLGNQVLSEDPANLGEIKPEKYVSGNYNLSIEAYDAYANKGILTVPFIIKNSAKLEPVTIKAVGVDQSGAMMGGDPDKTIAMLNFQLSNKADSNIEIVKVEVYDKQGNPDEVIPGMNFFDMIKSMQLGMEHLWVHSKDKVGPFPVSVDAKASGKLAAEYYDGWKLKITLLDSIMDKEFILETSVSVK